MRRLGVRKLYYLLMTATLGLWFLSILNAQLLRAPIVPDLWIGVMGVVVVISLLIVAALDTEIGGQVLTGGTVDPQRLKGGERQIRLVFGVIVIVLIGAMLVVSWPMVGGALRHLWPR
jgi:hypothetical protein